MKWTKALALAGALTVATSVVALAQGLAPSSSCPGCGSSAPPPAVTTGGPRIVQPYRSDATLGASTSIFQEQLYGNNASGNLINWWVRDCGTAVATGGSETAYCLWKVTSAGTLQNSLYLDDSNFIFYSFNNPTFSIDGNFHISMGLPTLVPTINSCGSGSPALDARANDMRGIITVGGGVVTTCSINFIRTWAQVPYCVVTGSTGVAAQILTALATTTLLTITASATVNGDLILYHCEQ